ncbi:MAG: ABC transporter permease [Caldilineaceae bacterium SB0662_bin_9]|uniref:ABC transporter permease n=1 Tax=Caldilineaceae bacterium SB0662_bin_9 TaxID=2605258 RepID=A0A6B1DSE0_9CHLR|nr:ABC transporter permease [Caldilineaceae bacterium]MXZ25263.1 ABC transporter permease [Caldilineaceae bacterium SB0665_bin_21]MYC62496.1 ABC transporter permease [Caldilineaceae bacterium SB0661_bin_34]MYD89603.1 ABC transporter permease [Caldilineaceae bacterium SB0662_bin_9]
MIAFLTAVLASGVRTGTSVLFATLGELFTERAGVLNLGVEGMMLMGAMTGFGVTWLTGNPWLGILAAMVVGGMMALLHAFVALVLRAEQVVSGLALTFLGSGLSAVLGSPLVEVRQVDRIPTWPVPFLSQIPVLGPILFDHNFLVYIGFLLIPLCWFWIYRTRQGLELRAIGENPAAADVQGIKVMRQRILYVAFGGVMAGLGGATLSLALTPTWVEGLISGQGWVAVGLVIFAGWDPIRAMFGSYLFGALRRLPIDLQNFARFRANPSLGYFTSMLPYLFTIVALLTVSIGDIGRRWGAPAALGRAYVREDRDA